MQLKVSLKGIQIQKVFFSNATVHTSHDPSGLQCKMLSKNLKLCMMQRNFSNTLFCPYFTKIVEKELFTKPLNEHYLLRFGLLIDA